MPSMTNFRRILAVIALLALSLGAQAQQVSLRTLPKDIKAGTLTFVTENVFTLDGRRIALSPGGVIRGANNLIITPNMLPRDSVVGYQLDQDGLLARVWVLTRDEAAKVNVATRYSWQTSPETGTSIGQVLGNQGSGSGIAQPGQRGQAPGFMQVRPVTEAPQAPITGSAP
jgi:hypothetical protein